MNFLKIQPSLAISDDVSILDEPLESWRNFDESIPLLKLPKSCDDLPLPLEHIFSALGVYEALRKFAIILKLTPVTFETFCASLLSNEHNVLETSIFRSILRILIRSDKIKYKDLDIQGKTKYGLYGPSDQRVGTQILYGFTDDFIWPSQLAFYAKADPKHFEHISSGSNNFHFHFPYLGNKYPFKYHFKNILIGNKYFFLFLSIFCKTNI